MPHWRAHGVHVCIHLAHMLGAHSPLYLTCCHLGSVVIPGRGKGCTWRQWRGTRHPVGASHGLLNEPLGGGNPLNPKTLTCPAYCSAIPFIRSRVLSCTACRQRQCPARQSTWPGSCMLRIRIKNKCKGVDSLCAHTVHQRHPFGRSNACAAARRIFISAAKHALLAPTLLRHRPRRHRAA